MVAAHATSDIITYVIAYNDALAQALKHECGISTLEYRVLAYLFDHPEGARPSELARIMRVSPAAISQTIKRLNCVNALKQRINDMRLDEEGPHCLSQPDTSAAPRTGDDFAGALRPSDPDQGKLTRISRTNIKRSSHHSRTTRYPITLTRDGINLAHDADIVVAEAHEVYFQSLPPSLRAIIASGSAMTNRFSNEGNRVRSGRFFDAFETFHAFLSMEALFTNAAHKQGLSLGAARMLFELGARTHAPSAKNLARTLLMKPSTASHAIAELERQKLVERVPDMLDRRASVFSLTENGSACYQSVATQFEESSFNSTQPASKQEWSLYHDASSTVVCAHQKEWDKAYRARKSKTRVQTHRKPE